MLLRALPPPMKKAADTVPVTSRPVRVPTCVMLGWKPCVTTRAVFALATFPTRLALCTLLRALPPPTKKAADTFPVTARAVRVPTCVMLGWKPCVTTRAVLAEETFPEIAEPLMFDTPPPSPVTKNKFEVPKTLRV